MATRLSTALLADCTTDPNFRAWAQFIEDTLVTTGGWVVVTDSGATPPSAMAHPTGANQRIGFRIYRMADALQATAPVYLRLDYGSGQGAGIPGVWITVGGGTNGAGLMTPMYFNGTTSTIPQVQAPNANGTQANNSYGSASTNRFSLGMFVNSVSGLVMVFTLERSKDGAGNDTGDGLLIGCTCPSSQGSYASRYIILAATAQPSAEMGVSYILNRVTPSESFGGDIPIGVLICYKGVAQQPGMGFVVMKAADAGNESSFTMTIYGAPRVYQQLGSFASPRKTYTSGFVSQDTSARVCIRYD